MPSPLQSIPPFPLHSGPEIAVQPATPVRSAQFTLPQNSFNFTPGSSYTATPPPAYKFAHSPSSSLGSEAGWPPGYRAATTPCTTPNLSPTVRTVDLNIQGPATGVGRVPPPGSKSKGSHAKKQPDGHIKRPKNSFIIFRSHFVRMQALSANVECDHRKISKIVGKIWSNMSPDDRRHYEDLARDEKAQHKAKYPDYRYSPIGRKDDVVPHPRATRTKRRRNGVVKQAVEDRRCDVIASLILSGAEGSVIKQRADEVLDEGEDGIADAEGESVKSEDDDAADADFAVDVAKVKKGRRTTSDSVDLPAADVYISDGTMPALHTMSTRRRSLSTPSLTPFSMLATRRPRPHARTNSDLMVPLSSRSVRGRMTNNSLSTAGAAVEPIFNNPIASGKHQMQTHARRLRLHSSLKSETPSPSITPISIPQMPSPFVQFSLFPNAALPPRSSVSTPAPTVASLHNSPAAASYMPLQAMSPPHTLAAEQTDFAWDAGLMAGADLSNEGLMGMGLLGTSSLTYEQHDMAFAHDDVLNHSITAANPLAFSQLPMMGSMSTPNLFDSEYTMSAEQDFMDEYLKFGDETSMEIPGPPSWPSVKVDDDDHSEWTAAYFRGLGATASSSKVE